MNHLISDWASGALYENQLKSDASVAHRRLEDLPEINNIKKDCLDPLLLIDTAGCQLEEDDVMNG